MSTDPETLEVILEAAGPGASTRRMFGEAALYLEPKLVALVCDDRLFLKPTDPGRALLPEADEAPPHPGSKPYLVVPEDLWEEPGFLPRLVATTADALPEPKPKKPKG